MTLKQYKWIDLLLFSIVAVLFEVINHYAVVHFSVFKLIFLSFTVVLTLISMYRWGLYGLIVMVFASIISVVITTNNNSYQHYVTYVCGGVLGMLPGFFIFQKLIGKKRIKNNFLIVLYLIFDFALVILCRSGIFALFKLDDFLTNLKALSVQESMSIFTSIIVILVANRKKGNILIEMKAYVEHVHEMKKLGNLKEMKESPNFNSDSQFTEFGQIDNSTILDGGTMDVDQLKELEKLYKESDKIDTMNRMDCLAEPEKREKDV